MNATHVRVLRIEGFRPGKQDIAIGQIERPRVAQMVVMVRHRPDDFGGHVGFIDVPVGLGQEQNLFAIMRPIGPLAEISQPGDPGREMVRRAFAFFGSRCSLRG